MIHFDAYIPYQWCGMIPHHFHASVTRVVTVYLFIVILRLEQKRC